MFGGHAVAFAFYANLSDALDAGDGTRILKLYEASLSIMVRMRLSPTMDQVLMDSLAWSDNLRVQAAAGADSILEFIVKVSALGGMKAIIEGPNVRLAGKLNEPGIRLNGKPISKAAATAIAAIAPFAASGAVRWAFRDLEAVSTQLNEQTKLMRLCQLTEKYFSRGDKATDSLVFVLNMMRVLLYHKDLNDGDLSVAFLTGQMKGQACQYIE